MIIFFNIVLVPRILQKYTECFDTFRSEPALTSSIRATVAHLFIRSDHQVRFIHTTVQIWWNTRKTIKLHLSCNNRLHDYGMPCSVQTKWKRAALIPDNLINYTSKLRILWTSWSAWFLNDGVGVCHKTLAIKLFSYSTNSCLWFALLCTGL